MKVLFLLLVAGLVFFGSLVRVEPGYGLYIKRSPSLDHMYVDLGDPPHNLEKITSMMNERYALMLIGYSEKGGVSVFASMPALP